MTLKTDQVLYFASHNLHKVREVQEILDGEWQIKSLYDLQINDPIPETGSTIEENAVIKAKYLYENHGVSCFADDSGLEVHALDGEPGVYSARYAGEEKSDLANMQKLLDRLSDQSDRKAQFKSVICYIDAEGNEHLFTGIVPGQIGFDQKGNGGFGYDPIFIPDGFDITFAEMQPEAKNQISHRARALGQLKAHLYKSRT